MSILDIHESNANRPLHDCGGTILSGTCCMGVEYNYCNVCAAYSYVDTILPNGTNFELNQHAWDTGEISSPVAEIDE